MTERLHFHFHFTPWKKSYGQPRQHIKKQRHYFTNKGPSSQGYGFSSSHVWMLELYYEESWVPKNWCFWTVVLEKTLQKADSFEKTLMLGKIEGRRRRGRQRMRRLDGITDSMDMSLSKLQSWWWTGKPGMLESMGSQRVGHDWATELNWTDLILYRKSLLVLWFNFHFENQDFYWYSSLVASTICIPPYSRDHW